MLFLIREALRVWLVNDNYVTVEAIGPNIDAWRPLTKRLTTKAINGDNDSDSAIIKIGTEMM